MRARVVAAGVAAALLAAACAPEEKLVRYKPFFAGLEGVQTGTPPVAERVAPAIGGEEVAQDGDAGLVRENPDGTKTLISRSGLHLMTHIQRTLADHEEKLFAEQVLSEITRQEFKARGRDPVEAFAMLKPYERDIAKLFARLPLGEHSPNARIDVVDRNMFRVRVTGRAAEGLRWSGFDMVLENGNWRLRWFVK